MTPPPKIKQSNDFIPSTPRVAQLHRFAQGWTRPQAAGLGCLRNQHELDPRRQYSQDFRRLAPGMGVNLAVELPGRCVQPIRFPEISGLPNRAPAIITPRRETCGASKCNAAKHREFISTMNQIASSILILSASICGYAAALRPASDGLGGIMSLLGVGLGLWGGLALLTSTTREPYLEFDESESERRATGRLLPRRAAGSRAAVLRTESSSAASISRDGLRLSPETSAQVSLAANAHGQSRSDLVEELLRRHLPRYTGSRVA